jgi:hypothetical protein
VVKDPEFLNEAEKRKLPINPLSGAEVEKVVGTVVAMSPDLLKAQRAITSSE